MILSDKATHHRVTLPVSILKALNTELDTSASSSATEELQDIIPVKVLDTESIIPATEELWDMVPDIEPGISSTKEPLDIIPDLLDTES